MKFAGTCTADDAFDSFTYGYNAVFGLGYVSTSKLKDDRVFMYYVLVFAWWSFGISFSRMARE